MTFLFLAFTITIYDFYQHIIGLWTLDYIICYYSLWLTKPSFFRCLFYSIKYALGSILIDDQEGEKCNTSSNSDKRQCWPFTALTIIILFYLIYISSLFCILSRFSWRCYVRCWASSNIDMKIQIWISITYHWAKPTRQNKYSRKLKIDWCCHYKSFQWQSRCSGETYSVPYTI